MTKGITIAVCLSAFSGSIALGQMKYSRTRSQQSPTPTPSPTPQATASPVANSKRPGPQQYYAQPKPTASLPMIPAQHASNVPMQSNQKSIPPQYTSNVPMQPRQTSMPVQRTTGAAPVQPQVSPAPGQRIMAAPNQPRALATPVPVPQKPTPTPVPPPDIQAYLDRQLASSKDKKFHLNANGKDLPLTPFHVWRQRDVAPGSTSTCVDMRSDEGRVYDIDFVTTGKDVTSVRVHRINGETVR